MAVGLLSTAMAAAAEAAVTGGSWYSKSQPGPPEGSQVVLPSAPTPDVPAGDFVVSAKAGQPDRTTFLHIDVSAIPKGSTVNKFALVIYEDPTAGNLAADQATVQAQAVKGYFQDGTANAPGDQQPEVDPAISAAGTRDPQGTWTFDITAIVSKWVDGSLVNNGIALAPAAGPNAPPAFQVVWSGKKPAPATTGQVSAAAAPAAEGGASAPPADTGAAPADTGSASPSQPVTITPDFSSAPVTPGTVSDASTPAPTPAVAPAASDTAAAGTDATSAVARPARPKRPSDAPPAAFWLAAIGVIGLVSAGALALGDLGEPLQGRRGSVLPVLERRARQIKPLEEPA